MSDSQELLRGIPSIDKLLAYGPVAEAKRRYPSLPWTRLARSVVEDFRSSIKEGLTAGGRRQKMVSALAARLLGAVEELRSPGLIPLINGTGVILHTNLGRAVLAREVMDSVSAVATGYTNLEYDLVKGERGKRGEAMHRLLRLATGAEDSLVVNNNAAAVYLVADTYSPPGKVIVSRGELVEIGGSFRLPTLLRRAAAEVVEVGTTNRTFASDYAEVAGRGDVLLKVHKSNYRITGFTHEASIEELVEVAARAGCFVVYDLGSGAFWDFTPMGLEGEEVVESVLNKGIDCVTMSGDKLMGGVQAGLILGKARFLAPLKKNPLVRALRVDKLTIAALEVLLRIYLFGEPDKEIPALSQAGCEVETLALRAEELKTHLEDSTPEGYSIEVRADAASLGGGSFAAQKIPGYALVIRCPGPEEAVQLARMMRTSDPPLLPRTRGDQVMFNLRSVLPEQDRLLGDCIERILSGLRSGRLERWKKR